MSSHRIHHVTAVTAQIVENLRFYTQTLGLRLVKKSVNQDDVSAYHLFYADAVGSPGTDLTFFDWPAIGPQTRGHGMIGQTTFRVRGESLPCWEERLSHEGLMSDLGEDETGRAYLRFEDFEGQRIELIDDEGLVEVAVPWTEHVPPEHALRGILGVDLETARPDGTRRVLAELLGYRETAPGIMETEDRLGRIRLISSEAERRVRLGSGGVHHVAFRVQDDEELYEMQRRVEAMGIGTSGYVDRFYFHSLYFREPGGILFELATDGPGFSADENPAELGKELALPPFLEPRRRQIEAGLKPLPSL
jgi:glyoxalase family protein